MTRSIFITAVAALLAGTMSSYGETFVDAGNGGIAATPETLTLRMIRIGYGINPPGSNGNQPRDRVVFADSKRRILYSSDKDTFGTSACYDTCTETWKPSTAADGINPEGHWSIIVRDDKTRQWAFRGRPMYTYTPENRSKEEKKIATEAAENIVREARKTAELAGNDAAYVIPFSAQIKLYHRNRVTRIYNPQPMGYPQGRQYLRMAQSGRGPIGGNAASFLTSF